MAKAEWKKIQERKWELKNDDGVVMATIFHKPLDKRFSLWVSSPRIFAKLSNPGITHRLDTLEEAQESFENLCKEQALPWCKAILEYFGVETRRDSTV